MKRITICTFAWLTLLGLMAIFSRPQSASAQPQGATVKINITSHAFFAALYQNGRVVRSASADPFSGINWSSVPEGDYELHIEAKDFITRILPIHVTAADKNEYSASSESGQGTLYFGETGKLLERVSKLEQAVKSLQSK